MPRTARVDFPGALHHLIARGIDRQPIVLDDADRNHLLVRIGNVLASARTPCFAWAIMPNHVHLLVKTNAVPISTLMQRLLTGHAGYFNRRHGRCGHLFQNRFRSILCQEDAYFLELVRYIHLNPIRANLIMSVEELESYPYCGHGAVLGRFPLPWQDVQSVLGFYHVERVEARSRYTEYLEEGIHEGRRDDLVAGKLVRHQGKWSDVEGEGHQHGAMQGSERILGDEDFIDSVLDCLKEVRYRDQRLGAHLFEIRAAVQKVAAWFDLSADDLLGSGKGRQTTAARGLLCYLATREFGLSQVQLARELGLSQSAVSRAVVRGRQLAKTGGKSLVSGSNFSW